MYDRHSAAAVGVSVYVRGFAMGRPAGVANAHMPERSALTLHFFLQIFQFLTNQLEVIKEALLTDFILRCNICFAQQHQVINIVTGFEKQASYGRISHFLISNYDRAHM